MIHVTAGHSLVLNNATISGGYVSSVGDGGILNDGGTLTVNGSFVQYNVSVETGYGGGIYSRNGQATLNNTVVQDNQVLTLAAYGGGGIANAAAVLTLVDSQVIDNSAPHGGGLFSLSGTLTVIGSMVADNTASPLPGSVDGGNGGGILALGSVTIRSTTIGGNQAVGSAPLQGNGGGAFLRNANVLIDASSIISNSNSTGDDYGSGGGILFLDSTATVANSTFSGNVTTGNPASNISGLGGGAFVGGQFGAANVTFINSSVANNSSNVAGGGVGSGSVGPSVTLSFVNTLLADNAAPADINCHHVTLDTWISAGHNLEDGDMCQFDQPTDQVNTDPLLDPLQDNGGPTLTHALLVLSPALDAGDDSAGKWAGPAGRDPAAGRGL